MASISKDVIEDRVARFAEYVRSSDSSMNCGFKPCSDWWISHETDTNRKNHENAYTFLDQIGVTTRDMVNHYGAHWVGGLGHKHFTSYIKTRKLKQTVCITILSADTQITSMAPNDKNIVGGLFQENRHSNSPWHRLRDAVCGEIIDTTSTTKKRKRSSNEKKNKINIPLNLPINNPPVDNPKTTITDKFLIDYWHSTEADTLFGKLEDEKDSREAVQNQINLLKLSVETAKGYHSIITPSSDEKDKEDMLANLSEYSIFFIRQKCNLLLLALNNALSIESGIPNWNNCCSKAIETASMAGIVPTTHPRTIRNWYQKFRDSNRKIIINWLYQIVLSVINILM